MKITSKKSKKKKQKVSINQEWPLINADAAGVDLGSSEHWVCVPADRDTQPVRRFGTFTTHLQALVQWLKDCHIKTVAMEATGVYWIPLFQLLESSGFQVLLVNARQIKNVSGRKTDVLDCQWIQRLHTYGLLGGSFRPADPYCVLRSFLRYRADLVSQRSTQTHHMQKALAQMNVQLTQVLSDINGESGMAIIEAILKGQRDPVKLAGLANRRVKASPKTIAEALVGDYRPEHLFVLQTAFELYHSFQAKIDACDHQLAQQLEHLPDRVNIQEKPLPAKADPKKEIDEILRSILYRKFGVDVTSVEGIGVQVGLTLLTEAGPDLGAFITEKHFASWLGVCPDNRISGGKILSCRTRRVINRLTDALRLAATTLERSQSALGAYYRRMKAKLGAAQAITATAHKLARILYRLIKHGEAYVRQGMAEYEQKYQARRLKGLQKTARTLGYQLVHSPQLASPVS